LPTYLLTNLSAYYLLITFFMSQILKISDKAQKIIDSYIKMEIGGKIIACPYFINIQKTRAALRVFLGKASAEEIIEEVNFTSHKEHLDLKSLSEKEIYQFLSEHNLGIDCSGLASHILQAEYQEKKNLNFLKKIKIANFWRQPWRYLTAKLRPIENISVRVLADDKNSFLIKDLAEVAPGDMIIRENLRHVYLITKIEKENNQIKKISFVHAPRPEQKNYFGPGIFQKTIEMEINSFEELGRKINDQIIIKRLNF